MCGRLPCRGCLLHLDVEARLCSGALLAASATAMTGHEQAVRDHTVQGFVAWLAGCLALCLALWPGQPHNESQSNVFSSACIEARRRTGAV